MSSSVCQGGIVVVDAVSVSWGPTDPSPVLVLVDDGEASQSDSAAREMASRRFLRWRDAAMAEDGKEGKEKEKDVGEEVEVEEMEENELEDMFFSSSFGDPWVGGRNVSPTCDGWVMDRML
jgi:hypothetical protein